MRKIKVIFDAIFGTQEDITYKMGLSFFISSVIFFVFALEYKSDNSQQDYFTIISAIFFALWIITTKGVDSLVNLACELGRILGFILIFCLSARYCLNVVVNNEKANWAYILLATMGLFSCILYFVCKVVDIFNFIKVIFSKIRNKVFGSEGPAPTKFKALIENCTAFLVTVGGFSIAIRTIIETIFQTLEYFTK